jgi:hypothetical protein
MKITKEQLKQIIKEELQNESLPRIQNPADPQYGLKSDLAGAEGRAKQRGGERNTLQDGMDEIEAIARGGGSMEDILAVIQNTSQNYQTDEDEY